MPPSFPYQNQGMVLRDTGPTPPGLRLRGYHPLWRAFPGHFGFPREGAAWPTTPHPPTVSRGGSVWAVPLSLAATQGIPFGFFSSPYWDVSVRGVPAPCRERPTGLTPMGREVPFGDPGIYGCVRLPRAYRSLPRPSSAPKPSHPPGGVACRVYSRPHPISVQPMRGDHREHRICVLTTPFTPRGRASGAASGMGLVPFPVSQSTTLRR